MEVDPLLAGSGSSTSFATSSLAENFDTFLTLLTVQLQNQDPLDPLDTNEFTSQLVQFTAVEQAIATNNNLESLIGLTELSHAATRISYLGKEVEAPGSTSYLTDGKAEWSYVLDDEATDVTITVTDSQGTTVHTATGETSAGEHSFTWDGLDDLGVPQPDGEYTITVGAKDSDGASIGVTTSLIGKVTGLDNVNGILVFVIGTLTVPVSNITAVRVPQVQS